MNMQRRTFLSALAVAPAALLAACGSDDVEPAGSLPPATDPGGTPSGGPYTYPTGADDVVLEYAERGGFTTAQYAFQSPPRILITGDGRVISEAPITAIYPGPLLPALQVRTITDAGIQKVLAAADEAGLFREIDYRDDDLGVADASTATVVVNVNGDEWQHAAYALGIAGGLSGEPQSEERQALQGFVHKLLDIVALAGESELGFDQPYFPDAYLFTTSVIDDPSAYAGEGIEPTIAPWPDFVSIRLAHAGECERLPEAEVGELFETATQLTFFEEDGVVYQVTPKQAWPGASC